MLEATARSDYMDVQLELRYMAGRASLLSSPGMLFYDFNLREMFLTFLLHTYGGCDSEMEP